MCSFKNLLFVFIAFSIFTSCEDSLSTEVIDEQVEIKTRSQLTTSFAPQVVGDRLKFEDYRHFKNYINDMTRIHDDNTEDFAAIIQDIVTFPKNLFAAFDAQVFSDPSNRFIPAVSDEVLMSLLNLDYEVQIDETLLTFITNDQIIASEAANTATKNQLRAIAKGVVLSTHLLPEHTFAHERNELQDIVARSWCGCKVTVEQIDCNTVQVEGSCRNIIWGDADGTARYEIVDQFNNVISSVNNIDVNGNFEFTIDITNLPTASFIFVDVDSNCAFDGAASVVLTPGSTCDKNYRSTIWDWSQSGDRAISFQTKYDNNFWGDYVQAKIYSYRRRSGRWIRDRAELTVSVEADVRGFSCFVLKSESETKDCNNCSVKKAREYIGVANDNFHFCTDDIIGTFEKIEAGITINETNTVAFECCN